MIRSFVTNRFLSYNFLICASKRFLLNHRKFSINIYQNNSRYSSNSIMTGTDIFKFSNYDSIGFDLDNTLLRYNVTNMMELEYNSLTKYLVEEKGYPKQYLYKPIDWDFLQKGLILDFERGNILKLGANSQILKATHGTKLLSEDQIIEYYGNDKKWNLTTQFSKDFLVAWNGPLAECFRTTLDYFDMPSALIFARIIDSIDDKKINNINKIKYNIWPDILNSLITIYGHKNFNNPKNEYFKEMQNNPEKYIQRTDKKVINLLRELKKTKSTFLITGSFIDFANLTATYALGNDWRNLFDVVICFARKPGFFTDNRPFFEVNSDFKEICEIKQNDMELNNVYSQGNWNELMNLLNQKILKNIDHKTLYVGDNLIQDVYTPSKYVNWDTITICEEMTAELTTPINYVHSDFETIKSHLWGSYFVNDKEECTLWFDVIKKYSKLCVPTVEELAKHPIDYEYQSFCKNRNDCGFYPSDLSII